MSQKYISDSVDAVEIKFRRDIESIKHRDNETQERLYREINSRIDLLNKTHNEDINSVKGNLTYLDSVVKKKVNPEEVKQISNSLKDMKYGYEREVEEFTNHIHSFEDKFSDFKRKFANVEAFVSNLKDKSMSDFENKKNDYNSTEYNGESSIKVKNFDEKIKNFTTHLETLKQEVDKKADKLEILRIENTCITKEEIISLLPSEDSK